MVRISALAMVVLLAAGLSAQAAMFSITSDPADTTVALNLAGDSVVNHNGATTMAVGDDNAQYSKDDMAPVAVFQLPDLGGEAIDTADFSFRISWGQYAISGGVDVYAVRWASSKNVLASDWDWGQPLVRGVGTLIQDNIVVHNGANQPLMTVETDDTADALLAAWLTDAYAAGAVAGDYVFIRLNGDRQSANSFTVPSANHATEMPPTLTITTVPEPATMGLLALGGLAALKRRR